MSDDGITDAMYVKAGECGTIRWVAAIAKDLVKRLHFKSNKIVVHIVYWARHRGKMEY